MLRASKSISTACDPVDDNLAVGGQVVEGLLKAGLIEERHMLG
jgi:hypothetical protein